MAISIQKRTRVAAVDPWSAWAITTDVPPYIDTDLIEYKVSEATDIRIDALTKGSVVPGTGVNEYTWVGTGIFDILINAVIGNIKAEYDSGRISGQEYATVYLGALQSVINTSATLWIQKPDSEAKIDIAKEQKNLLLKQQLLVERQTKGFDDDAKQKLLKQILDSWSVAYSVAQNANSIPDSIKVDVIDSVMKDAYSNLGITTTTNPIGIV